MFQVASRMATISFLLLSLIVGFLAVRIHLGDPVHFGPVQAPNCGGVQGEVPNNCGGKLLNGAGTPLDCGTYAVAVKFEDMSGVAVVAKVLQTPNMEDDELPESEKNSRNECALAKFLQSQSVPNVIRCESECMGKLQLDNVQEKGSMDAPVMITAPFVKDTLTLHELEIENREAIQKARHQTLYTGAYMLAAGVVNSDMRRNVLHAPDGTTTFIDLGLARIIHTQSENATWEELDLNDYGFVESFLPHRVPLHDAHNGIRQHINDILQMTEQLGWPSIEKIWHSAWEDAGSCAYKVHGLREAADETLHGLRLVRAASYEDPRTDEAQPHRVEEALKAGSGHTGLIWAGFKQEALEKAEAALELSDHFENLRGFAEIKELLS